jgi:acetyl esterase/lipase
MKKVLQQFKRRPMLPQWMQEPVFTGMLPQRMLSTGHAWGRALRRDVVGMTPQQIRTWLDGFSRLNPGPSGGTFEMSVRGGVPTAILRKPGSMVPGRVLMIHGGGFAFGSSRTHRALGMHLAMRTGREVWIPEYRLAPEHPFPAGVEDVIRVYDEAVADGGGVVVVGDSAGGNLAAVLVQAARNRERKMPSACALLSPWLDLRPQSSSNLQDAHALSMFDAEDMRAYSLQYLGEQRPEDPQASPLLGDFQGFPRTHLQVSATEYLFPDAMECRSALEAAGVPCEWYVDSGALHGWQLFPDFLPEAQRALDALVRFIGEEARD